MKLGSEEIRYINAFEAITGVSARSCTIENGITFLVTPGTAGRAIGKKGTNVKMLRKKFRKHIAVFEYFDDPEKFFRKAFSRIKIDKIKLADDKKTMNIKLDPEDKRALLQNLQKLKNVKEVLRNNYNVENLRIR